MEITKVLLQNYMPYSKGVIIGRAIPSIDGLKPSQRKILYTMHTMHLLKGDKTKSTNIVGQTMRLHPHGDQTIYDTLVRMTTGNETLNVPYIESKGNFGKVYSRDLAYAASRYTEAKLAGICEEIFDGIDENAVEFIPNYDDTMTEPTLLPTKFPTILCNPSNGIAVGFGSSIPSFGIKNVCNSVIGILNGTITDVESLVNVLGIPEFTTGGIVHIDKAGMVKIAETGKGSILMTGVATTYPDHIVISELPYRVTSEAVVAAIEEHAKSGELKEVASVSDETDLKGFRLVVNLKRGCNPQAVLQKLYRLTPLRTQISFHTRVIIEDECVERGFLPLLQDWISFRVECIRRVYTTRYEKSKEKEHILSAWEKVDGHIKDVVDILVNNAEATAKQLLMTNYGMDEIQADYFMDMRVREITLDRMKKKLKELAEVRTEMAHNELVMNNDNEKFKIIIEDQQRIISKYGKDNKTHIGKVIDLTKEKEEDSKIEVDNDPVTVILTKNGYMKRLVSLQDLTRYSVPEDDTEVARFNTRNNEHILVFTYDGTVYKILVNSIDASRGKLRDNVAEIIGVNPKQIMLIDAAGDYSKHFNVVYPNGRGYMIQYSRAIGKRTKYRSLFEASEPGQLWWTFEDKFFMVTARRKAAYCDLSLLVNASRAAFKVARVSTGDSIFALLNAKDVPDITQIDLDKYNKEYTVLIGEDELWPGARKKFIEARNRKLGIITDEAENKEDAENKKDTED